MVTETEKYLLKLDYKIEKQKTILADLKTERKEVIAVFITETDAKAEGQKKL